MSYGTNMMAGINDTVGNTATANAAREEKSKPLFWHVKVAYDVDNFVVAKVVYSCRNASEIKNESYEIPFEFSKKEIYELVNSEVAKHIGSGIENRYDLVFANRLAIANVDERERRIEAAMDEEFKHYPDRVKWERALERFPRYIPMLRKVAMYRSFIWLMTKERYWKDAIDEIGSKLAS